MLIKLAGLAEGLPKLEEHDNNLEDLVARASKILITISESEYLKETPTANVQARLRHLEAVIGDINSFAEQRLPNYWKRVKSATTDGEKISALKSRLEAALTDFNLGSSLQVNANLPKLADAVRENRRHSEEQVVRNAERDDNLLLSYLPHVAHTWDDKGACLPDTRVKVLDDIQRWARTRAGGTNVFWLSGIAGCGKSTIAHSVAARLHNDGMLASCIFFKREKWAELGLRKVFSTLARDLAIRYPDLRQGILKAIRHYHLIGSSTPTMQFSELIKQPVSAIPAATTNTSSPRVIVWDAIDECKEWRAFLDILSEGLPLLSSLLKFIIISRPFSQMDRLFGTIKPEICHLDLLPNTDADIKRYLLHGFQKVAVERDLVGWPGNIDISPLVKRADGLFICAAVNLKRVERSLNPPEELRALLVGDLFLTAEEALQALYALALHEVDLDDFLKGFQEVTGAILVLQKPKMTIAALQSLTGYVDTRTVIRYARAVLLAATSVTGDVVPQLHTAFSDYLTSRTRCTHPALFIHKEERHARMATHCLRTMHELLRPDICEIQDTSCMNSEVADLQTRLKMCVPEALNYASRYFSHHVSMAAIEFTDLLLPFLRVFYKSDLLKWLEVMSLLGLVNTAIVALDRLRKSVRIMQQPGDALDISSVLADDAVQFAKAFEEVIVSNALHIHISALTFTPRATELYKTYHTQLPSQVLLVSGSPESWASTSVPSGKTKDSIKFGFTKDGIHLAMDAHNEIRAWESSSGASVTPTRQYQWGPKPDKQFRIDERSWVWSNFGKRVVWIPPAWRGKFTTSSTHIALCNQARQVIILKLA